MATNDHEVCEWFHITNFNVLNIFLLALGLGICFGSNLYWLLFRIDISNELIFYAIYSNLIPAVWLQMGIKYVSGST